MKEKREKKRWGLIAFIVLIMLGTSFSIFFNGFQSQSQIVKHNGLKFVNNGNFWVAKISGRDAAFNFLPADVENIPSADFSKLLQGKYQIDSTSEVNGTFREPIALVQYQMGLTLQTYNIYLRKGFTTNTTFGSQIPIIICNNATQNVPVVYFTKSNSTSISVKENCVVAEALTSTDVIRVKDRLLYGILGVIK